MYACLALFDCRRALRHSAMQTSVVVFALLLLAVPLTANDEPPANGVIFGIAFDSDGNPARGMSLRAFPLGVALGAVLPSTKTNDNGEYRFEKIPWRGRFTVYAEDEEAGYSGYSTGHGHQAAADQTEQVELTPEHREAELIVHLPPKAGFMQIRLTNRETGTKIPAMRVAVMSADTPDSLPLFTMSCYSNHIVLLPPNKNLLLHVSSDEFREWDESVGTGKPIRVSSGERLVLRVELQPSRN